MIPGRLLAGLTTPGTGLFHASRWQNGVVTDLGEPGLETALVRHGPVIPKVKSEACPFHAMATTGVRFYVGER